MTNNISKLLKAKPNSIEGRNRKTYSYSVQSKSFDFYTNQFKGNNHYDIGSSIQKEDIKKAPTEMIDAITFLQANVPNDAVVIELGGGKYQRRSGFPYAIFDNYIPIDISLSSIIEYSEMYDRIGIACDAQKLPLKDGVVDVIYTHTFLEHPLNPDMVVKEIHRVLKNGGIVIHSDAWHCRWWKQFGIYGVKEWSELTIKEKCLWLIIYFTEIKIIRFPIVLTKRIFKELFISKKSPIDLFYKKLTPNYDLKIYSDEDAAASIDPIDLIRFYESRGYELVYKKSFLQRIFFKDTNLYLTK
jgi:SAM-dependent methyltransferase